MIVSIIGFVRLAMSGAYIDAHVGEIREYAYAIEARLDDFSCTLAELREANRRCIDVFKRCNEKVTIIETDFAIGLSCREYVANWGLCSTMGSRSSNGAAPITQPRSVDKCNAL